MVLVSEKLLLLLYSAEWYAASARITTAARISTAARITTAVLRDAVVVPIKTLCMGANNKYFLYLFFIYFCYMYLVMFSIVLYRTIVTLYIDNIFLLIIYGKCIK